MRRKLAGLVLAAALVIPAAVATPVLADTCPACGPSGQPPACAVCSDFAVAIRNSRALSQLRQTAPLHAARVEKRLEAVLANIAEVCGRGCDPA
jgi:hypothetical protein